MPIWRHYQDGADSNGYLGYGLSIVFDLIVFIRFWRPYAVCLLTREKTCEALGGLCFDFSRQHTQTHQVFLT